ncbi:MAG TPA: zinc ribbon domain-containing protein [Anaerolineales bacterium]|nr:zinc ribbon domain-containing protein [Anaerolineales bacterium]
MESHSCPKCNEPMDEGDLSVSGTTKVGYISKKQKGMFVTVTVIKQARACPNCGYVEFYLDPKELKQKIS